MDRIQTYVGQSILEWNFSKPDQNAMVALGKLAAAIIGTSSLVNGLACTPLTPAAMSVSIAAGEIYQQASLEASTSGTLPQDTAHVITKQGIALDAVTVPNVNTGVTAFTAPGSAGQSINYLIEAIYADSDVSLDPTTGTSPVVLPFYNSAAPQTPLQGPNGSGASSTTFRKGIVSLQVKAGVPAATGSQLTPAPDVGYVGLYVVTVANGQTTIVSGNISTYAGAPFINSTLHGQNPVFAVSPQVPAATAANQAVQFGQVPGIVGAVRNGSMVVAAASATATYSADALIVSTGLAGLPYALANFNSTINLATTGVGGMDTGTAPVSGFVGLYAIYNPTTGAKGLLAVNATAAKAPEVYGGANMPAGYTASALVAVLPTNVSGQFAPIILVDRKVLINRPSVLTTTTQQASLTALSTPASIPKNAKRVAGDIQISSSVATSAVVASIGPATSNIGLNSFSGIGAEQPFFEVDVVTSQTVYYTATAVSGTMTLIIWFTAYFF